MKHEWSGDCDFGDGNLQEMIQQYHARLDFVKGIGVKERNEPNTVFQDLEVEEGHLLDERKFLNDGHKNAETVYKNKMKQSKLSEESLFALAWDVEEYEKLTV